MQNNIMEVILKIYKTNDLNLKTDKSKYYSYYNNFISRKRQYTQTCFHFILYVKGRHGGL